MANLQKSIKVKHQNSVNDPRTEKQKENGEIVVILSKADLAFGVQAIAKALCLYVDDSQNLDDTAMALIHLNDTLSEHLDYVYDL